MRGYPFHYFIFMLIAPELLVLDAKKLDSTELFSDVIKNISRINNMLDDLIQKYRQLHKFQISHSKPQNSKNSYIISHKKESVESPEYDPKVEALRYSKIIPSDDDEVSTIENVFDEEGEYDDPLKSEVIKSRLVSSEYQTDESELTDENTEKIKQQSLSQNIKLQRQEVKDKIFAKPTIKVKLYAKIDTDNETNENVIEKIKKKRNLRNIVKDSPPRVENKEEIEELSEFLQEEPAKDDQLLSKELYQTEVLRKAYGDACLKVAVKKCYMACRQAILVMCKGKKCNNNFISTFKNDAKRQCINEFSDKEDANTCSANLSIRDGNPVREAETEAKYEGLNILRDKYEDACKEESSRKCTESCKCAYGATRDKYNTIYENLKKYAEKACKTECNKAYSVGQHSDSSASSSDSESSDGSSTSDTVSTSDSETDSQKKTKTSTNKQRKKKKKLKSKKMLKSNSSELWLEKV